MRKKLIFLIYRILLAVLSPLLLLYWVRRALRDPRYRKGLAERLGLLPDPYQRTVQRAVWLHAVSVGEIISSVELIRRWQQRYPDREIFVSCATVAGREVAEAKLQGLVAGIFYAPVDYVFAVRRVLRRIRPALVVVMETEIWPNLWNQSRLSGARLVIINGRISDRAYPSYRRWRFFFEPILRIPDSILVQSARDLDRYLELGAPADRTSNGGNLKYDFDPRDTPPPPEIAAFLDSHSGPVWIAASTMPPFDASDVDEDDVVLRAFAEIKRVRPDVLLLLVPRRPERFDVAASKLEAGGWKFVRRSQLGSPQPVDVLLLDSMGELSSLFSRATVVFMGGTIARRGGHNILEPACFAKPVIIGPNMQNFTEIAAIFREARAVRTIEKPDELAQAVLDCIADPGALGGRARAAAEAQRGATAHALDVMTIQYDWALPGSFPNVLLWALSRIWVAGGHLKRSLTAQRKLDAPVISIGGIAMGGVGKTPIVDWLAAHLSKSGHAVAILTRGYRRISSEPLVLPAGSTCSSNDTGDEAQIYLRSGHAAVGVASDRFAVGRKMQADVFLLDDGFQHARLQRNLDIVVLDALDPFAGNAAFPLGRMREDLTALARADAFILHRADRSREYSGVRAVLKRHNPSAAVFRSWVVPECWIAAATGERVDLDAFVARSAVAFCGLANPAAFWDTLDSLGYRLATRRSFPDHHKYNAADLETLRSQGAGLLLTTEKDVANLSHLEDVWFLRITVALDDESAFLRTVGVVCPDETPDPR